MSFSLGEYQDIFLEEADELLQELNRNLLELERNPDDEEIVNNIFRAAHSLKSSAAFVGLNDLSDLAHRMENLLQGIRDKTNIVTPEVVDVIFKCFDTISEVIELVASGVEPHQNLRPLIDRINSVNETSKLNGEQLSSTEKRMDKAVSVPTVKTTFTSSESDEIKKALSEGMNCYEITVIIEESAQMKWVKGQLIAANLEREGTIVKTIPTLEDMSSDETVSALKLILLSFRNANHIFKSCDIDQIEKIEIRNITTVKKDDKLLLKIGSPLQLDQQIKTATAYTEQISPQPDESDSNGSTDSFHIDYTVDADDSEVDLFERRRSEQHVEHDRRKTPTLKTVKVSVDKLDLLLNNVGELVIANSGFYRLYEEIRKYAGNKGIISEFKNRMEQMSRIAKDLQTGIMKTRMVPIGQVFSRFNRLVRDLAKEHNKSVELVIKGEDTELDKKVIDVIGEPLLHLIRNAVDHGIESQEERVKNGKSETATITLNAYQGGNQIFVEISDDGKGLDIEAIKRKIIEKNISTAEILANMDDADIYNYIFIPGFSTAKKITDISGRGVGMNVVKETVNELNGNVSIETENGMGTRFVLTFPLTLAIIPAIMVKVRKEVYAIPLSDVIETIKISQTDIATIESHEVINLRGEILSLLRLNEFVGLKSALSYSQKIPVVVVGYGNRKIGLIVDFLEGKMEIVIKSLEQNYTNVEGLAGASILGDGSICLILDIQTMINRVISQQDKLTQEERIKILKSRMIEHDNLEDMESDRKITPAFTEEDKVIFSDISSPEKKMKQGETSEKDGQPNYISDVFIFDDEPAETKPEEEMPVADETELQQPVETKTEAAAPVEEPPVDSEKPVDITGDITDAEIQLEVKEALSEFRDELKQNISDAIQSGLPDSHITAELNISKEEINEFNLLSNMGAANAAESLSKILNKRIDLSIPEVKLTPVEKIPDFFGNLNEPYMGVMLGIEGEINGTLLLLLEEKTGFELIDILYGTDSGGKNELSEDGVSALKELTNIIGSSILNVYAEKSNMVVKPNVPTFVHDYLQSVMDSILIMHTIEHDYAIVMETAFYFENDQVVGNLMILPETESLKVLVKGFKSNVRSD
jgi:two-component system chemotaxis sensor kinase CheA